MLQLQIFNSINKQGVGKMLAPYFFLLNRNSWQAGLFLIKIC